MPHSIKRKAYHRTSSGWSDERRAKHSAAIRAWSPWVSSTGPRTAEGKAISRCNALTHGATSRPAKDFMRNFELYRQFLRLCWQKRKALANKNNLEKQQNELLNVPHIHPLSSLRRRPESPCNAPLPLPAPSTYVNNLLFH
jgi:hypothetical protein